jgi:hypothetical protein
MDEEMKKQGHRKWKDWSVGQKALAITGGIIAGAGLLCLCGFAMMWLWNWLMPKLFSLPEIGYWEAWGILILSHILFRGFHGGNRVADRSRKHRLRNRIREMSDDDTAAEKPVAE